MKRVEGKVALITGAARGQGRSHAVALAEEGADIIAIDACQDFPSIPYDLATPEDLEETVRLVEAEDRRIIARQADVRDQAALDAVVAEALTEFGHIDIVCANAGVCVFANTWETTEDVWNDQVDIMMGGVWRTVKAVVPTMIEQRSGSIIITSSLGGIKGLPGVSAYCAAKFGNVGMAQSLAHEVGEYGIRVNTIHPTNVNTGMINNDHIRGVFVPGLDRQPTQEEFEEAAKPMNIIPIGWVEPRDISNAVLYLASDESRYVTGLRLSVDAGAFIK